MAECANDRRSVSKHVTRENTRLDLMGPQEGKSKNVLNKLTKAVSTIRNAVRFRNAQEALHHDDDAMTGITGLDRNQPKENTYKMEPDEGKRFQVARVRGVIRDIMTSHLSEYKYESESAALLAQRMTQALNHRLQGLNFPRYKFVSNVILGERCGQGINSCSRFLWDQKTDNFVTENFSGPNFFAISMVHAVYFE